MKEEEDGAWPLARAHRKDRRNTKAVVAHADNTPSNDDEGDGEGGGDDTKREEEEEVDNCWNGATAVVLHHAK